MADEKLQLWVQVKLYLEANGKTWENEYEKLDNIQLRDLGDGNTFINRWDVDGLAQPTNDQLAAVATQAQKDSNNIVAVKKRKQEYPELGDIIDALFKKEAGDSTEWDALVTARAATKTKYAKE